MAHGPASTSRPLGWSGSARRLRQERKVVEAWPSKAKSASTASPTSPAMEGTVLVVPKSIPRAGAAAMDGPERAGVLRLRQLGSRGPAGLKPAAPAVKLPLDLRLR